MINPKFQFIPEETIIIFDEIQEYPDVIRGYIETGNFSGSMQTQEQIKLDYEEDVRKYAEGLDQTKIISVYRSSPAQLEKENKKFQFYKISKNARSREYTGCIEWLIDAGVIIECNCLFFPELPLKGNADVSKYKLYYPDTGLLVSALDEEAQEDFFVRTKNELIPIEVKSNNNKSKSLDALIKNDNYSDIKHGIKLGDFNIGYANNI